VSPVGCTQSPKEIYRASRRWAERRYADLRWWNELDKGGHFPAFEQPPPLSMRSARSFARCGDHHPFNPDRRGKTV